VQRLDANKVAPRLYQGGRVDGRVSYRPFTMLVLCSEEHQPRMERFRGKLVRPAFSDTVWPTERELTRAFSAARRAAGELYNRGRVLVTCTAGLNRSGLVTGLALCFGTHLPGDQIVDMIRAARGDSALGNHAFEKIVRDFAQSPDRHRR
jgi:protein-tyrosine phosphatase